MTREQAGIKRVLATTTPEQRREAVKKKVLEARQGWEVCHFGRVLTVEWSPVLGYSTDMTYLTT